MAYIENPKTKGSGIQCCIPQTGTCPNNCADCFFQSGRSYLEPLGENLPNMPFRADRVIRVNDGNDSNVGREGVISATNCYPMRFFNTAIPKDIGGFPDPVILTLNPGRMTDSKWHCLDPIPANLMAVRIRTNMWNLESVVDPAVAYYGGRDVPIFLTFMAYFIDSAKDGFQQYYCHRKRTMNSYSAITTAAWESVMARYKYNKWVYSCGRLEGEKSIELKASGCRYCGNCLREYFATKERMEGK